MRRLERRKEIHCLGAVGDKVWVDNALVDETMPFPVTRVKLMLAWSVVI